MDVSILIRQGTRYALARATLIAAQFVLGAVITFTLIVPLLTQKQMSQDRIVAQILLFLFLIAMLRLAFSKSSKTWLDKKFFREAYDADRVLGELSEEVRKFTESKPLLETVSKCVAETLHVTQIGMMQRNGTKFSVSQAVGVFPGDAGNLALAANSSTIRNLSNTNAPARLYRDDPDAWYLMADEDERQTLDDLGTELLLPLPGRNRLMGVMALGPKRSEAAYSKSDLHLLQVLATQTGMALEVSELAHSLANEAAQRERVNREIEIAREVQERLFPQDIPAIPGGSIAGYCRPAQGIGGDYYDVFPLEDGRIGLAIGDVSGKGISAALLMASLRASLRGVTLDSPREFAKLMDKVNRLVYEASASNRYATFFFGALDPVARILECVNAGHNAPLVVRRKADGSAEILRLEADGPVVGLLPFAPYSEQSLQLQAGDLLVAYTDGISEAMTRKEEEWGEERMMVAATLAGEGSAKDVLKSIFTEADKFTAGAPQHDDMTLLVVKLNRESSANAT
jgi:sigma-B regulation protein RsbU (phosphoserine phosphatase)